MSKTALAVGELAVGAALIAATAGAAAPAVAWGLSATTISTLMAVGVSAGITGVFGLLQPLLNPNDTSVPGSQQNYSNSAAARRIAYGVMETGGVITFDSAPAGNAAFQNQGPGANFRHQIYTVAGHEITAFGRGGIPCVVIDGILTQLQLDPAGSGYFVPVDENMPYAGNPSAPGTINPNHIFFEFDLGSPGETAAFPLLSAACPDWAIGQCIQKGCAKVHVAMRYDYYADGSQVGNNNLATSVPIYVNGSVPTFRFPLVGKPVADTRLPAGGSNPAWQADTGYSFAEYIYDSLSRVEVQVNGPGGSFESGISTPTFPPSTSFPGQVTPDNQCQWLNAGPLQAGGWPGPNATIGYPYVFKDPNGNLQLLQFPTGAPNSEWLLGTFITGATEPTWATTPGQQTADNGQEQGGKLPWLCLGAPAGFGGAANPSNPALIIFDWLTDADYGEGADPSTIDIASINAAANICEEQVVVYVGQSGGTISENRYACDGVFDQDSARGDVLKSLLSSMAGTIVPPGDMWHVFAGAYNAPTANLTDADIRGPLDFDWRISRRDLCNGVKGSFIPSFLPTNTTEAQPTAWRWTDFPPYQGNGLQGHPNYIAEDGGEIIWKDVRFGFTTSIWMAQRLAKIVLQLLRFQVTGHLACKFTAFPVQAGDTITFTHARWAALAQPPPTTFFVTKATPIMESGTDGVPCYGVDLTLRETDPSVYEFGAPTQYQAPGAAWVEGDGEYSTYGSLGVVG
jgi:hypothetical protein